MKKRETRNEFRYNNKTKHPNFIFEIEGGKYHAVGLTHSPSTFGRPNMPLKKNPKKNTTEQSYIRNGIITAPTKSFSKRTIQNMEFSEEDSPNVKSKVRNYKNNRKKKSK